MERRGGAPVPPPPRSGRGTALRLRKAGGGPETRTAALPPRELSPSGGAVGGFLITRCEGRGPYLSPALPCQRVIRKRRQALADRHPPVYNTPIAPNSRLSNPLSPFRRPGGNLPLQGAGGQSPPSGGRGALSPFRGPGGNLPLQETGGHNPDARTKGAGCKNALRGEMSHNVPLSSQTRGTASEVKWRQMTPNDTFSRARSLLRTPDGGPPTSNEGGRGRAIPAQGSAGAALQAAGTPLPCAVR